MGDGPGRSGKASFGRLAEARLKINRLLEDSGERFFDDAHGPANICLENNVKITQTQLDEFGEDFDKTTNGFVNYLLLDEKGFSLAVLEAKREERQPLVGKEQARKYAKSQNCRFVILSTGNLHYFWDLERGNRRGYRPWAGRSQAARWQPSSIIQQEVLYAQPENAKEVDRGGEAGHGYHLW